MKEIRARALTKRSAAKVVLAHTHTRRERKLERAKESRVAGRRLFLRKEVCLIFFFYSLLFSPNKQNVHPPFFTENANFLENEKKKLLSMSKMLLRRRAFSTIPRAVVGPTNVRAFFEKNPDAAEAVPLLVFVSTGEWFFITFFFFCISLNI